jgi:hypothetical protein
MEFVNGNYRPMAPWPVRHKVWTVILSIVGLVVILAIAGAIAGPPKKAGRTASKAAPGSASSPSAHPRASSQASQSVSAAATACDNRQNASGDIYVRIIAPGEAPVAQELGGEWRWDYATNMCLTSVQFTIAGVPQTAGNCTQVGYVTDNPGYNPNATPAKPLNQVVAQSGPAC